MMSVEALEKLIKLWPLFLGIIGIVVWLVRLESRTIYTERDLNKHQTETKEKFDEITKKIEKEKQS